MTEIEPQTRSALRIDDVAEAVGAAGVLGARDVGLLDGTKAAWGDLGLARICSTAGDLAERS